MAASAVVGQLRAMHLGEAPRRPADWRALATEASGQGVEVMLFSWLRPVLPDDALVWLDFREAAARLRHEGLLRQLWEVLDTLHRADVRAVALKGPLLAERLYRPTCGRPSTDLDVLVGLDSLDAATAALAGLGYASTPDQAYYLAVHHHLVLVRPHDAPVELHFYAQSAFGVRIPAAELLDHAVPTATPFGDRRFVPCPIDEFVYLAAHAAHHRFGRLGWTHDLCLLAAAEPLAIEAVCARARTLGVERAVRLGIHRVIALGGRLHGAPPRLGARATLAMRLSEVAPNTASQLANDLLLADTTGAVLRHLRRFAFADVPWRRLHRATAT